MYGANNQAKARKRIVPEFRASGFMTGLATKIHYQKRSRTKNVRLFSLVDSYRQ
jgi:hypothetical protein